MAELALIPVSDLLLDVKNPRFKSPPPTQQEAALILARDRPEELLRQAADIAKRGLDPTQALAVVPTSDQRKRYVVAEGNRRLLAVRALETPPLVQPALSTSASRRLATLAGLYEQHPITRIQCAIFDSDDDPGLIHWIHLRHTGQNQGIGLVPWGSEEQDRFRERHAGTRSPARQLLEFAETRGKLSEEARESKQGILTTVERLVETTDVRDRLGIDLRNGQLVSLYPEKDLLPVVSRIVEDLKLSRVRVKDLYYVDDRRKYLDTLPKELFPKPARKLKTAVLLDDLTSGVAKPRPVAAARGRKKAASAWKTKQQTAVIPAGSALSINPPRINQVYNELLTLDAQRYPNACAVLLRVFVEMSVDWYATERQLNASGEILGKRLRVVGEDLLKRGLIPKKLKSAIDTLASSKHTLGPTLATFHQYVHNEYVFPRPDDLFSAWREIEPWMTKIWAP